MKKFSVILAVLICILALVLIFLKEHKNLRKSNNKIATRVSPLPKEVVVNLDKDGFTPKEITVSVGTAVVWKNTSGAQETVNSDNYPTNQLHKEINFGIFNNGSSVSYIFKTPGTYGYHNQLHPEENGKIIVVQK